MYYLVPLLRSGSRPSVVPVNRIARRWLRSSGFRMCLRTRGCGSTTPCAVSAKPTVAAAVGIPSHRTRRFARLLAARLIRIVEYSRGRSAGSTVDGGLPAAYRHSDVGTAPVGCATVWVASQCALHNARHGVHCEPRCARMSVGYTAVRRKRVRLQY